ncbi:MAG: Ig-like domain-containing protein [Saprospiraceae bacterium]|nr:Ig-like domain-containing protein [Saprospiraceae bacterium]
MKNRSLKFITFTLLVFVTLFTVVSCKRDLDDLEPATFPTTAEVFIDGFSAGLNYGAFGGSKVTAFDVDSEEKYKGTASMKFAVPDAGDPQGAYAGGAYFTSVGRDLSGYDALTFWAKASKAATIDVVGFGNDFGESRFQTVLRDVKVNTNWQKFIIPIPDASKLTQERGMFFYSEGPESGLGYTFWIDEVTFENLGTLAHPRAAILDGQDQEFLVETGQTLNIGGTKAIFNLPTGVDQSVDAAPSYFTFSSSNPSVASVSSTGAVSIVDAGSAVITAKLGDQDAAGSMTVGSTGQAVGPQAPAPTPTVDADSVISMFCNAYNNVPIDTWNTGWQFSTAELLDIQIAGDDVKRYRMLNFVGIEFASQTINASAMTHFHLDIWTPDATALPAAFKVLLVDFGANGVFDGGDDSSHELSFSSPLLQTGQWVGIDVPLSNFTGLVNKGHLAQLVLSGDLPNVYVDNVYFYKSGSVVTTGPTVAAPVPTRNPADVISIFSDAYTNAAGTDFNPNWGQATVVSQVPVAGNNTLLYSGLNYQGTQLGSNLDVSSMTHLHLDVWTNNSSALSVFLISPGPIETPSVLTVPTSGWASVDIPLSSFSPVDLANIIQFKFDGNGDIYLDNIYFYKPGSGGGTTPTTAAPTPTFNAANVISIFSDAYTNVAGSDLNPNWGQATIVTQEPIAGNNTLVYTGLNYQGLQLGSNQNVSGMTNLHLDFWTANATALKVFLISPGPIETPYTLTVPTSGWSSVDIPLTAFAPVDLTNVIQFKFEGDGKIYLDNILFHN